MPATARPERPRWRICRWFDAAIRVAGRQRQGVHDATGSVTSLNRPLEDPARARRLGQAASTDVRRARRWLPPDLGRPRRCQRQIRAAELFADVSQPGPGDDLQMKRIDSQELRKFGTLVPGGVKHGRPLAQEKSMVGSLPEL